MKEYTNLNKETKKSLPANAINWISTERKKEKEVFTIKYTVAVFKSDSVYINQLHKPLIKDV